MADDEYLTIKIKPEFTQEDMQSFTEQLSSLMANATLNMALAGTATADGATAGGGSSDGKGGMTEETKKDIAESVVKAQQDLATKGQTILKQVQAPTTEETEKMNTSLSGLMSGTLEVGKTIFSGVTSIFNLAKKATEGPLSSVLNIMEKLFNLIFLPLNVALTMTLLPIISTMAQGIARFVQSTLRAFDEKGIVGLIEATFEYLWELFMPLLETLWNLFVDILPKMWRTLFDSGGFGTVIAMIIALIPGVIVAMAITKVWQVYVSTKLLEIWALQTISVAKGGLIALAITAIVTAITLIILNWDTIKKWCEDIWNGIVNISKAIANAVTDLINTIVNAIGNMAGNVWDSLTSWIPHFASGGVVGANAPQLAWIGDNESESEVVAPYSTIVSAVGTAMHNNSILTNNSNSSRQIIQNTFYISGSNAEEIGESVLRTMDKSVTKSTSKWGV